MIDLEKKEKTLFNELFVLELANNHWGNLSRGFRIIDQHSAIVRKHKVKAAIKLQIRDVDNFVHDDFKGNKTERYIKKTEKTKLSESDFVKLIEHIKSAGCIPMATPFDERSVDFCKDLNLPLLKIASSDISDWPLIEKVATKYIPTIVSNGGSSETELDNVCNFFNKRNIPLAINHCVSHYPTEDSDLELNQIDYLKNRYPENVIGFSTHEYQDWHTSMYISFAKGARTWERHIDIDYHDVPVSKYCSLPGQIDEWFAAYWKAKLLCGNLGDKKREISKKERDYLDALLRGVYAKRELKSGYQINDLSFEKDFYLAIPLQKAQISCREVSNCHKNERTVMHGVILKNRIEANSPLRLDNLIVEDEKYSSIYKTIVNRGL
ncbi:N-acetylneuraminate synthase family protein [Betaproteobacteria bacterium]|nr:N-acetylneuraminate synthase family protein [Betaproteobacteria bacterium]